MDRGDLTEAAWQQLRSLLPTPRCGGRGRPRRDDRPLLNGMRWILRTGAPWRDLPGRFGPWQTVYHRFTTWRRDGVWERVLRQLQGRADHAGLLDWSVGVVAGTVIRAHQHAAGARKRPAKLDVNKGARTTRRRRWGAAAAVARPSCTAPRKGRASRWPRRSRPGSGMTRPS